MIQTYSALNITLIELRLKGTVMEIEKALMNDCLCVSKVS